MPKMKTHKGTAKRVHVTGSGKLLVRYMNPKKQKRTREKKLQDIRGLRPLAPEMARKLRKALPYSRAAR
jgi:large subunit ribosomal protein L35